MIFAVMPIRLPNLEEEIRYLLIPKDPEDDKNAILEIRAGTLVTASFVGLYHAFGKYGKIYGNAVGFIGFSPCIAFLSAGIPMTVVGYKKHNKLKQQQLRKEF